MTQSNTQRLVAALVVPIVSLESVLQELLLNRSISTATGVTLDQLGVIVGQPRNGLDDDTYRRYIRARVAAHRSDGTFEALIKVASLVVFDADATYVTSNEGTATVRIFIDDLAVSDDLATIVFSFLQTAKVGGVRVLLEWGRSPTAGLFRYDSGPGYDVGKLAGGLG